MPAPSETSHDVRVASADDRHDIGRLLHDFNIEYDDITPGPTALAERIQDLMARGQTVVLLAGPGPDALAVLRFQPSLWTLADECYLAELYVSPAERGHGLGEAVLSVAIDHARERGADYMHLGTSEDDVAARALYEKLGFRRTEGDGGPVTYAYERDL